MIVSLDSTGSTDGFTAVILSQLNKCINMDTNFEIVFKKVQIYIESVTQNVP